MMLSVLKARLRAGAEDNDAEEADRGSEMGHCMEFLGDEFDGGSHIQSDVQKLPPDPVRLGIFPHRVVKF